jgi:tellurite resistance protein
MLAVLAVAAAANKFKVFGQASAQVGTICYSASVFLLMIPTVTEPLTRLPPGAPLVATPEAPIFPFVYATLFVVFLTGVNLQVRRMRMAFPDDPPRFDRRVDVLGCWPAMSEDVELLKATIAVAVADGELRRSELGVVEGLARRAGVGQASFDAMLKAAQSDATFAQNIVLAPARARQAIVLLVAQARIDGRISPEERRVIVRIAMCLGIGGDDFRKAYDQGLKQADSLRSSRQKRSEPPGTRPGRPPA